MSKSSTHKNWKGHCLMCASYRGKVRGKGDRKFPWAMQRKLGQKRRFRNAVPD